MAECEQRIVPGRGLLVVKRIPRTDHAGPQHASRGRENKARNSKIGPCGQGAWLLVLRMAQRAPLRPRRSSFSSAIAPIDGYCHTFVPCPVSLAGTSEVVVGQDQGPSRSTAAQRSSDRRSRSGPVSIPAAGDSFCGRNTASPFGHTDMDHPRPKAIAIPLESWPDKRAALLARFDHLQERDVHLVPGREEELVRRLQRLLLMARRAVIDLIRRI